MPRIKDDVLVELIENDGCRRGSLEPINAAGAVRLALDLMDARRRIRDLENTVTSTAALLEKMGWHLESAVPVQSTVKPAAKRTKKK